MSEKAKMPGEELLARLAAPFPASTMRWKVVATDDSGKRCAVAPYVDPRAYQQRLDEVLALNWQTSYELYDNGRVVLCTLTITDPVWGSTSRSDVGEVPPGAKAKNVATSALAQAFKRACAAFGMGRYLYKVQNLWVDYDAKRKQPTKQALSWLASKMANPEQAGQSQPTSSRPASQVEAEDQPGEEPTGKSQAQPRSAIPTSPRTMLAEIEKRTGHAPFKDARAMLEAVKAEAGISSFPAATDIDGWRLFGNAALDAAKQTKKEGVNE